MHDWLTGMRGGERCLEVFAELLPDAPILTLFHEPGSVSPALEARRVVSSPLSRWRFLRRHYRKLLPFYPRAMAALPGTEFELVVSLSHCAAKAVPRRAGARHICYCFTPARYLWDQASVYLDPARASLPVRLAARSLLPDLRAWDRASAAGVDRFVAISRFVADRIECCYGRHAEIVYPPVECSRFRPRPPGETEDFDLMVTALAPYKGVDLAVRTYNRLRRRLVVVGRGEQGRRLRRLAGPTVELRGWLPDTEVADLFARARAFLLPCEEDFGITPLESMASGRPVIALARGGARETVVDGVTGLFFEEPVEDAMAAALARLDRELDRFDPAELRRHAEAFDTSVFRRRIATLLAEEGAPESARPAAVDESGGPAVRGESRTPSTEPSR